MGSYLTVIDLEPLEAVGCPPHSFETHNFHIKRFGNCLYCNSGSEAVHKSLIEEACD